MIELTDAAIDTTRVLADVRDPACGAEVLFVGTTRQWTSPPRAASASPAADVSDLETSHLVYDAYQDMARTQMSKLELEARQRWPIRQVVMIHRLGTVAVSEASVAVAVSAPHRREAFEAASWLIDELKRQVPIWKQEHYVQRGATWIHPTAGQCQCPTPAQSSTQVEQP